MYVGFFPSHHCIAVDMDGINVMNLLVTLQYVLCSKWHLRAAGEKTGYSCRCRCCVPRLPAEFGLRKERKSVWGKNAWQ